jgi:hypothetical protein
MTQSNLPPQQIEDSAAGTKLFFDSYGQGPLEFNSNDVDVTLGFFEKKGFSSESARVLSATLLKQAKIDGTPIGKILDSLKGVDQLELSQLVGEILNNNRAAISTLGFRTTPVIPNQSRNIPA